MYVVAMYCKDCGHKGEDDAKFCTNCGSASSPLLNSNEVSNNVALKTPKVEVMEVKDSIEENTEPLAPMNLAIVLGVVAIVIGVILFALFYRSGTPAGDTNDAGATSTSITSDTAAQTGVQESANQPSQATATSDPSGNLLPSFIALIEPNIVEINCYSADGTIESSGSGLSYVPKGTATHSIETNYHVYSGAITGGLAPTCYAVFPQAPNYGFNDQYGDYQLVLDGYHYNPSTYEDAAIFNLGAPIPSTVPISPIPTIEHAYTSLGISPMQCPDSEANVGDGVTIFGYPNSGNSLGVSETVTEGIVSGILSGPIYKTNAGIDHGNSGGVAILNKIGCALGIPTLGSSGLTGGIGYIQSYSLVKAAVN
jgi:hypothetical protein